MINSNFQGYMHLDVSIIIILFTIILPHVHINYDVAAATIPAFLALILGVHLDLWAIFNSCW